MISKKTFVLRNGMQYLIYRDDGRFDIAAINELVAIAKSDFPNLREEDIRLVENQEIFPGRIGIEFKILDEM